MSGATDPIVSVVIATYNRSYVLRHAIQSVCRSTLADWELIVVGDACTDDTAEVVASFLDPRIRFVNLPQRCGDQSGPNNCGVTEARGRYVAFLNHNDFYLPEHLATCVKELETGRDDFVWVAGAAALPKTAAIQSDRPFRFMLSGVPDGADYTPLSFCLASCWVFRRSLAGRVGPWTHAALTYVTPSQAWLFRVWRSGAKMRFLPTVSVVLIPADQWPGSYARRESPQHEWLSQRMRDDPKFRETLLEEAAIGEAMQHLLHARHPLIRRLLLRPIYALLTALGMHPYSLSLAILHGRRGNMIRKHKERGGIR